jgi:hypothetical protein
MKALSCGCLSPGLVRGQVLATTSDYSTVHEFRPVELVELAGGPNGCGEVARGGCLFAWNFIMTRSTVLWEARRH